MLRIKRRSSARVIFLIFCVAMVVAACARQEIRLHAVSYNKAISDYGNKQVLLNAVRASKRYPMYFSGVGGMTGGGMLSGGVTSQFPFKTGPGNKLPSFNVNPNASLKSGLSQVAISNLNTKEFQEGIFKVIDPKLVQFFLESEWPKSVLLNILVSKIELSPKDDRMVGGAIGTFCRKAKYKGEDSRDFKRCRTLREDMIFYRDNCRKIYRKANGNSRYFNAGDDECDQRNFSIFITELRILGIKFDTVNALSNADFKAFSVKKKTVKKDGTLNDDKTEKILESIEYSEANKRTKIIKWIIGGEKFPYLNTLKITVSLRSPYAMIVYLGKLIKAQLYIKDRFTPSVVYGGDFVRRPLFVVRRGTIGRLVVRPAVSVMHEGTDYYIPRPNYGDTYEARSMQVLDLINQIIIHQTKKTDLPKTSTIQLISD